MRQRGFSLIELMIVVSIIGVLATIAAPSLRSLAAGQRVKMAAFDLYTDLTLARSEAIKRNANVTITRNGTNWSTGWSITAAGLADPIKSRQLSFISTSITGSVASITFNRSGRPETAFQATTADADGSVTARCVQLDLSGRPATTRGACL